jgi:hypothetical protein
MPSRAIFATGGSSSSLSNAARNFGSRVGVQLNIDSPDDHTTHLAAVRPGVSYNGATHVVTFTGVALAEDSIDIGVMTVDDHLLSEGVQDITLGLQSPSTDATIDPNVQYARVTIVEEADKTR